MINGIISDFKYDFDHYVLEEFRECIRVWLKKHKINSNFHILSNGISLFYSQELSNAQIKDFEREFDVKLVKYEVKCNLDVYDYDFINV